MSDNTPRYIFSLDEENYGPEEFDTRADALEAARNEEPEGPVWTGIIQSFNVYKMLEQSAFKAMENFAEDLNETVCEDVAYETVGDWPDFDPKDTPAICKALADAMLPFVPKPYFWGVRDVEEHEQKDIPK